MAMPAPPPVVNKFVVPQIGLKTTDVVIATSASLSAAANLGSTRLCAIIIPTGTEGASVTFQASVDGTNYFNVYGPSGEYSIVMTAATVVVVSAVDFLGFPYIKVRTGTAGSATNQSGADATLTLVSV